MLLFREIYGTIPQYRMVVKLIHMHLLTVINWKEWLLETVLKKLSDRKGVKFMYDIYSESGKNVRYVLGTKGGNTLIVFGINPSTATAEKSDPTISRIDTYLKKYGYDSFKMLNVYPLRATNPDSLPTVPDAEIHKQNIKEIKEALNDSSAVLCAWGNLIYKRKYLKACFADIAEIICNSKLPVYCLETTKSGNPRHPLARTKMPDKLISFDINSYRKNIL